MILLFYYLIVGRFGGAVGRFFVVLGRLGGLFGVLEGLGRLLGGSWEVLGASWGRLGPSWVVRVVLSSTRSADARHLGRFWEPKGAKMEPKWSQNRTQDGPKSKIKTRTKKEALEDRLEAVLARSWVVLGAVLRPKSRSCPRRVCNFQKSRFWKK